MLHRFLISLFLILSLGSATGPNLPDPSARPVKQRTKHQQEVIISTIPILRLPYQMKPEDLAWTIGYGNKMMDEQCKAQPTDLWCSPLKLKEEPLDPYDIVEISLRTKRDFVYTSDIKDNWRVNSALVLEGKPWFGDCDDLASTTLDMMVRAGQPLNKIWFLLVDTDRSNVLNHMIGIVEDKNGHYWIVGDTADQNAYPVSEINYQVAGMARGDKIRQWEDPRDLSIFPLSSLLSLPVQGS